MREVQLRVEVVEQGSQTEFAQERLVVLGYAVLGVFLRGDEFFLAGVDAEDVERAAVADAREPVVVEAERKREDAHLVAASSKFLQQGALLGLEQADERALY